jgi:hypothetical protein
VKFMLQRHRPEIQDWGESKDYRTLLLDTFPLHQQESILITAEGAERAECSWEGNSRTPNQEKKKIPKTCKEFKLSGTYSWSEHSNSCYPQIFSCPKARKSMFGEINSEGNSNMS